MALIEVSNDMTYFEVSSMEAMVHKQSNQQLFLVSLLLLKMPWVHE